jgi:catechol 2,3-dioxygenase-like lactoylglutathione lyase family enzyme
MIEGLGCVWLEVADLERSVAFYRDGLRFQVDHGADALAAGVVLRAGDLRVCLVEVGSTGRRRGAGIRLALDVAGLDAYRDALVARGIGSTAPVDRDGARHFSVRDPDGYLWQFYQGTA